jgi:hypothetical protein
LEIKKSEELKLEAKQLEELKNVEVIITDLDKTLITTDSSMSILRSIKTMSFFWPKLFWLCFLYVIDCVCYRFHVFFQSNKSGERCVITPFEFYNTTSLRIKLLIANEIESEKIDFAINQQVMNFLLKNRDKKIILATGAVDKIAKQFAQQYDIFDFVISSSEDCNCVGITKANEISKHINILETKFLYIGDSKQDVAIWQFAYIAGYVQNGKKNEKLLKEIQDWRQLLTEEEGSNTSIIFFD